MRMACKHVAQLLKLNPALKNVYLRRNLQAISAAGMDGAMALGAMPMEGTTVKPRSFFKENSSPKEVTMTADYASTSSTNENKPSVEEVEENIRKWQENVDTSRLNESDLLVHEAHLKAVQAKEDFYVDPSTNYQVFTIRYHLQRGNCCGNLCRHCPYDHFNVQERYKALRNHNTAFFS